MIPIKLEEGYDFITLYFKSHQEMLDYSKTLYHYLIKLSDFPHKDLQRKNFAHLPGDVPHFHFHEEAPHPHFHILFPNLPTKEDWDLLYIWGNRRELSLPRDLVVETIIK